MGVPLRQQIKVGLYILGKQLRRESRYPLVLMLEPLFRCNLACAGCGKIDYPDHILNTRISVEDAIGAAEEGGAPVISTTAASMPSADVPDIKPMIIIEITPEK